MKNIIVMGILFKLICGIALGEVLDIQDFRHARLYHCDQVNKLVVDAISLKAHDAITDIQIQKDSAILMRKGMERLPKANSFFLVLEKLDGVGQFLEGKIIPVRDGNIVMDGKIVKVIEFIKDRDLIPKVEQFLSPEGGSAEKKPNLHEEQ